MSGWLAAVLGGAAVLVAGWRRRPIGWSHSGDGLPRSGRPTTIVIVGSAAGLGSLAVASGASVPTTAAGLAATGLVLSLRRRQSRAGAIARRRAAVVDLTYAAAGELRAGREPREALRLTIPVLATGDPQWQAAFDRDLAGPMASAELPLREAAGLPGADNVRYLAAALGVAQTSGGRVVAVLERLGAAMDADEELRQELDAAMAGPRASMVLLAGLPVLGIGLGQAMGAAPLRVLLHRPLGWGLLGAGTVLDLAGVGLIRLITRSALRG
jgi:tight adherence protein B